MKVITADSEHREWDGFVQSAREATAYHQFAWKAVITKSFGHRCYYLAALDTEGRWQGVLPLVHMRSRVFGNFLVSMPFVNYGGVLCKNDTATASLLDQAERLRRSCGAAHVELRHQARGLEDMPTSLRKVSMVLELADSADSQWGAFTAKLRNQIRKAEKSGLTSRIGHLEQLSDFYDVFARNMRDLGTPVYTKKFFRHVLEAFPDTTRILAIYHDRQVVAAGIALWFKNTLEVPWASSIRDYKALCPNNMLYWEAIQFAIRQRITRFDFGRSTPGEGTFNFKKQWGALPVQLHWQYLMDKRGKVPELNPSNPKYQAAIRLWQRLPVPVTRLIGPPIVRNIP